MRRRLPALLVVAAVSGTAAGTVSTARADKPAALLSQIPALPRIVRHGDSCPIPSAFGPAFRTAADRTDLPLPLLVAVAEVESRFDPLARSRANARGLLQLLPSTAESLRLDQNVPRSNVLAGALYLRLLLERFQSPDLAIAAYNAGPAAVARAGGAPTGETLTYVFRVNSIWRALRGCH